MTVARYLIPRLIPFVTNVEPEDPEHARSLVAHSLCLYVGTVDAERAPAAMSLVIPMLMARATAEGEDLYSEISSRLLEVAAMSQDAFRSIVGAMSAAQRTLLEEVVRSGRQASSNTKQDASDSSGQPTIQLKMNFGA